MVKMANKSKTILLFFSAPDGKIDTALERTGIMLEVQQPSSNLGQPNNPFKFWVK